MWEKWVGGRKTKYLRTEPTHLHCAEAATAGVPAARGADEADEWEGY